MDLSEERSYARLPQNQKKGVYRRDSSQRRFGKAMWVVEAGIKTDLHGLFPWMFSSYLQNLFLKNSSNSNVDRWFSMIFFYLFSTIFFWGNDRSLMSRFFKWVAKEKELPTTVQYAAKQSPT